MAHEPGGWVDGADVAAAVEAEAFKSDNVEKLTLMTTTDQAHLFVSTTRKPGPTAAMLGDISPSPSLSSRHGSTFSGWRPARSPTKATGSRRKWCSCHGVTQIGSLQP